MKQKDKQITDATIALLCATRDDVAILLREIERRGVQAAAMAQKFIDSAREGEHHARNGSSV